MKKKFLFVIIVLLLIGCSKKRLDNNSIDNNKKEELINELLKVTPETHYLLDYNFYDWIYNEYGSEIINRLNNSFNNKDYSNSIWRDITGNSLNALYDLYNNNYDFNDNITILKTREKNVIINFVGDISLADNFDIMPYYDSRNEKVLGILSKDIVEEMNNASIMVANNEFSISNRGKPLTDKTYTFRANPLRLSIYDEMG